MRSRRPIAASSVCFFFALTLALGCSSLKRFAYEGFDRDAWQHPDRVIETLGIEPGIRVADLGSGGGYFTFRLADAVGAEGVVYAVDVDEEMVEYLRQRVTDEEIANVEVILATPDDPRLRAGAIDLLFTVNTYHHIEDRTAYFAARLHDLRLGGRVAILELNGASWFARQFGHFTPRDEIVEEMSEAGYRLDDEPDFIDRQSFLIFSAAP